MAQQFVQIGENGGEEATEVISANDWLITGGVFQQTLGGQLSRGGSDIWLQQYDTLGSLQWQYTIGSISNDQLEGLALFSNQDFCLLGQYRDSLYFDTDTVLYSVNPASFISRHASSGKLLWAKNIKAQGLVLMADIVTDAASNIYITGAFKDTFQIDTFQLINANTEAVFVVKMNSDGVVQWAAQSQYSTAAKGEQLAIDKQTKKVYLVGNFESYLSIVGDTLLGDFSATDIFLTALDSSGQWLWQKQFGGVYQDEVAALLWQDNALYMGGQFVGVLQMDGIALVTAFRDFDCFVAKLDTQGNVLWAKQSLVHADCFLEGLAVSDSQIVAVGYFRDSIEWQNSMQIADDGLEAYQLLLDINGNNPLWQTWKGSGNDLAKACTIGTNGNISTVGSFQQDLINNNNTWNAIGFSDAFLWLQAPVEVPNAITKIKKTAIKIFPNPATSQIIIETKIAVNNWQLIDIKGQQILQGNELLINLENINPGIYILKIKTPKGIHSTKIIKY